jgi:hypothetical protein
MNTGVASSTTALVAKTLHVKSGARNSVIPGARSLTIVVSSTPAASTDATDTRRRPMIHRSVAPFPRPENGELRASPAPWGVSTT